MNSSTLRPGLATRLRTLAWPQVDRTHLVALLCIALMAWMYLHRLDVWLINDDEEGYLYAAWRISQGELPYRDFLTPQLPAFLFPGALIVRLFGVDPWAMRAWSAALVLVTGLATYLTGRRLFGPVAGLAALVLCLAIDDVFAIGRAFRPEATMLAFGALALYAFVRADASGRRTGYALASLLFGGALLAKLFGLLPWLATLAYVGWQLLRGQRERRRGLRDLAALAIPGGLVVVGVMGAFRWLTPETYTAVLGHHLMQGQALSVREILVKNLGFYWHALNWHASILMGLPLGILAIRRIAAPRGWVVVWQLPTAAVFLFLTRELWARHLVYLVPAFALIFGAGLEWIVRALPRERRMAGLTAVTLLGVVALPYFLDDADAWAQEEIGTARLAELVRTLTPADARIMADYPGIGFYGQRATTYSGAGLSEGATESGQITGAKLLEEMKAGNVALVLIDRSSQAGQLADLHDFESFDAAVQRDYTELGKFYRHYQPYSVYRRKDLPQPAVDFGWGSLIGLGAGTGRMESGGTLEVDLVFQVRERPAQQLTAFLHLDDAGGNAWGQGDGLLTNALFRGTEEWEPGELVAVPLQLRVEPGTPPGRYRLRFGIYDPATGRRQPWTAPEQGSGDAWDAGEIEVVVPQHPADAAPTASGRTLESGRDSPAGDSGGDAGAPPVPDEGRPEPGTADPYRLLAIRHPGAVLAGSNLPLRLTWRAERAPGADHQLRLVLTAADGSILSETTAAPSPGWPTSAWRRGEIATTLMPLLIDPSAPGGAAALSATWLGAAGEALSAPRPIGRVEVTPLGPAVTAAPALSRPLDAHLGEAVALLGSDLPDAARPGEPLRFTLAWRTDARLPKAYTVLTHLVRLTDTVTATTGVSASLGISADPESAASLAIPADAAIAAQADGPPAGGARPTTSWRPGEVIADARELALPGDLAPGRYAVLVGLYDGRDPAYPRLPVVLGGAGRPDGRVPIGILTIDPQ